MWSYFLSGYLFNFLFPVNSQSSIDIRSVMITALKHETKKYHLSGGGRAGRCSNGRSFCDCVEIKHSQADPWNGLYGGEKMLKDHSWMHFTIKGGAEKWRDWQGVLEKSQLWDDQPIKCPSGVIHQTNGWQHEWIGKTTSEISGQKIFG